MGGYDIDLALLAALIGLLVFGAGRYSVDAQILEKPRAVTARSQTAI